MLTPFPYIQTAKVIFFITAFTGIMAAQSKHLPSFEQYKVTTQSSVRAARPKLNTKMARLFRTAIRNQATAGPNFAGNYTIALLGCGSSCRRYAIVDARSGDVYLPKELDAFGTGPWVVDDPLF